MKSVYLLLGISALALSGLAFAQEKQPAKKAAPASAKKAAAGTARGVKKTSPVAKKAAAKKPAAKKNAAKKSTATRKKS